MEGRGGYERGALPPPPLGSGARSGGGPSWDREPRPGRAEPLLPPARESGWRGGRERLPPPPQRRGDRRDGSADVEAGELLSEPNQARLRSKAASASGWDQMPSPAASPARAGDTGRGIGRTVSMPASSRGAHAEPNLASSVSADFPGPPPLLRAGLWPSDSYPAAANGEHALPRGSPARGFPALPHHLAERSGGISAARARILPPGIAVARQDPAALPPAPPLLASPVLDAPALAAPASPFTGLLGEDAESLLHGAAAVHHTPGSSGREAAADEATPASDDPPKRKRLGWGQGLARLRSCDKRGSDNDQQGVQQGTAEPHSPAHPAESDASTHAASEQPAAILESPALSSAAEPAAAAQPAPREEPAEKLPPPPPLLLVDPADGHAVVEPDQAAAIVQSAATEPPSLATAATTPSSLASSVKSPLPPMPLSPPPPLPSPEQPAAAPDEAPAASPAAPLQPQDAALQPSASAAAEAAAAEDARAAKQASKDAIMRGIDGVDADIEALEAQVAALSADLGGQETARKLLDQEVAALQAPQPHPLQPAPSQDLSAAEQAASQVHDPLKLLHASIEQPLELAVTFQCCMRIH